MEIHIVGLTYGEARAVQVMAKGSDVYHSSIPDRFDVRFKNIEGALDALEFLKKHRDEKFNT